MVKLNKVYLKGGEEFLVTGFGKMKSKTGYIDVVSYKLNVVTKVDASYNDTIVERVEDFENEFLPKELEPGMKVQAISMGRVIREYTVESIGNGKAVLISIFGAVGGYDTVIVECEVRSDGTLNVSNKETRELCGYDGTVGVEFKLVTPPMERRQKNNSIINSIANKLKCGAIKAGKINRNGNPEVAEELLKLVEELLGEIEIRITE